MQAFHTVDPVEVLMSMEKLEGLAMEVMEVATPTVLVASHMV